jgi:hypothetical protein
MGVRGIRYKESVKDLNELFSLVDNEAGDCRWVISCEGSAIYTGKEWIGVSFTLPSREEEVDWRKDYQKWIDGGRK